jgi:ABC-type Na+ efflux pump permease subunit
MFLSESQPRYHGLGGACRRRYIGWMEYAFVFLIVLAMLGALGALGLGIINMARGNNPRRSNKLMQSRVMLQALALLLFAVFMLLFRH